jgi:hypothetical protein
MSGHFRSWHRLAGQRSAPDLVQEGRSAALLTCPAPLRPQVTLDMSAKVPDALLTGVQVRACGQLRTGGEGRRENARSE